jgi:hypothetical protein
VATENWTIRLVQRRVAEGQGKERNQRRQRKEYDAGLAEGLVLDSQQQRAQESNGHRRDAGEGERVTHRSHHPPDL